MRRVVIVGNGMVGHRVTRIDRAAKRVATASGASEPYDDLVLVTGSTPFVPSPWTP